MTTAVVDASVWCDVLLPGSRRQAARDAIEPYNAFVGPEHLRLEIVQVLRRHARTDLGQAQVAKLIDVVRELPIAVEPAAGLLSRIWELRNALSAYDAAYVAAAEAFDVPLLTRDKGLLAYRERAACTIESV